MVKIFLCLKRLAAGFIFFLNLAGNNFGLGWKKKKKTSRPQ